MFEASLTEKFKRIFDIKKVTFDQPGESQEQECLFINVEESRNNFRDKKVIAKVTGSALVFAKNEKLPFGFFSKAIELADPSDTLDLFFFDIETNTRTYQDIVMRGFSFVYFFNSQYDPDTGSITSIELESVT